MLTLGYKASAEQFSPRQLLDFAVEAEAVGFDSVWVSDHFQPWRHTNGHAPFSLAWLGAVGERTNRVILGTSVLTPTFRYSPPIVAQAFGTLASMFPGRVVLGVGSGESLNEVPVSDMSWPNAKERLERLNEAVKLIRLLWEEDSVSFEGKYYRTHNATIYDRPSTPTPIYIGAAGPNAARLAGELGDGLICTSGKGDDLYSNKLLPSLAQGAILSGRPYALIERAIEVKVSFDADRQRALSETRIWAALALPAEDKAGIDDPRELERRAETVKDQAHNRWLVSNDPDEHVEQIRAYVDLGFNHLIFHSPTDDQSRFIQAYAADVIPRLRQITPSV